MANTSLKTIGDIAKALGIPKHRVTYAVDKAGVEPVARAGILRLFGDTEVARIQRALEQIRS